MQLFSTTGLTTQLAIVRKAFPAPFFTLRILTATCLHSPHSSFEQ